MKDYRIVFFASLTLLLAPKLLVESKNFNIDPKLDEQYHWIMFVDGYSLKNYLAYNGSTLQPIDEFAVTFRQTTSQFKLRNIRPPVLPPVKYENFWYHDGKALGLRRFNDLDIPPHLQGAILLRYDDSSASSENVFDHPLSGANCITRLLLEVYLNKSLVSAVLVPDAVYERICNDLSAFRFYPIKSGLTPAGKKLTLHVIAYPSENDAHFYYEDEGQ